MSPKPTVEKTVFMKYQARTYLLKTVSSLLGRSPMLPGIHVLTTTVNGGLLASHHWHT